MKEFKFFQKEQKYVAKWSDERLMGGEAMFNSSSFVMSFDPANPDSQIIYRNDGYAIGIMGRTGSIGTEGINGNNR